MISGRRAIVLAVFAVALIAAAYTVLSSSDDYEVEARFQSASQLVEGNLVTVGGETIGEVKKISLTDDGQALVRLTITEGDLVPLKQGTRAIIRQLSLSGQANRYVALQMGPADGKDIPAGAELASVDNASVVELDELFNTFDKPTRQDTRDTIEFFKETTEGREREAGEALGLLDPALASTTRLLQELDGNEPVLAEFVDEVSELVTDTATKDEALASLVGNLRGTFDAIAGRKGDLESSLDRLPGFLRRSNTTFANLRATLDDLDPLVDAARPVVRDDLNPLLRQLEPFARESVPAVRDLARTVRRDGADNDLVELLNRQEPLADIAVDSAERNGANREGALPAAAKALAGATPQLAFFRPYTPELIGWFDDFSASGAYDALGSFSRAGLQLNQYTVTPLLQALPIPLPIQDVTQGLGVVTGRNNRCPGSMERPAPDGSNAPYKPSPDFNCDPAQRPIGR